MWHKSCSGHNSRRVCSWHICKPRRSLPSFKEKSSSLLSSSAQIDPSGCVIIIIHHQLFSCNTARTIPVDSFGKKQQKWKRHLGNLMEWFRDLVIFSREIKIWSGQSARPSKCKNAFPEEERGLLLSLLWQNYKIRRGEWGVLWGKPRVLCRVRGHSFGERVNGGRPWEVLPQIVDSFFLRVQLCTQLNLP